MCRESYGLVSHVFYGSSTVIRAILMCCGESYRPGAVRTVSGSGFVSSERAGMELVKVSHGQPLILERR